MTATPASDAESKNILGAFIILSNIHQTTAAMHIKKNQTEAPNVLSAVLNYLAAIGRKGGQKSRRTLTPAQAKAMVKAREAKRKHTEKHENAVT